MTAIRQGAKSASTSPATPAASAASATPSAALRFLAAGVAHSRVHAGVHYPGDTVVGALIGTAAGQAVAGTLDRHSPPPPG